MQKELHVEVSSKKSNPLPSNGDSAPTLIFTMEQTTGDLAAINKSAGRLPFDASKLHSYIFLEINNRPNKAKGNKNLSAKIQEVKKALSKFQIQAEAKGERHASLWFVNSQANEPSKPQPNRQATWKFESFSPSPVANSHKVRLGKYSEYNAILERSKLDVKTNNQDFYLTGNIRVTPEKFFHSFLPPTFGVYGFWWGLKQSFGQKKSSTAPFWQILMTALELVDAGSHVKLHLRSPGVLTQYTLESKEFQVFKDCLNDPTPHEPIGTQNGKPQTNEDATEKLSSALSQASSSVNRKSNVREKRSEMPKKKGKVAFKDQKVKLLMQKGNASVRTDAKPMDFYNVLDLLGTGGFGVVKKVEHKVSKQMRAMKMLKKTNMPEDQLALTYNEIQMVWSIDHPHVGRLYDVFDTEETIYIVMDLFSGGDLFEKISDYGNLSEYHSKRITREILSALQFLHSNGIVHRDLKPENIMMVNKSDESPIKVIDFGISGRITPGEKLNEFYGTCFYMAPELVIGDYDEKIDLWSTGVIVYMMLSASLPFYHDEEDEIYQLIVNGDYSLSGGAWDSVSEEAKDFVSKLLTLSPEARLSARDALKHPWLTNTEKKEEVEINKKTKFSALKNFKSFQAGIELQRAVFEFMATNLSIEEEKLQLLKAFSQIDKNGDGILTCEELLTAVKEFPELDIDEKMVKDIFGEIDSNLSGEIDYNEFLMACMDRVTLLRQENLKKAFELLDEDKSGFITSEKFKKAFGINSIGENGNSIDQIIDELISDFDTNSDGVISFEEFVAMMQKIE